MQLKLRIGVAVLCTCAAVAEARAAGTNDPCVVIDEQHDMLPPADRTAAARLVARQFELEGQPLFEPDCPAKYTISHIVLGRTIVVRLEGPGGRREGKALGMDDLPALYSQMVRSMITGLPMEGFNVIDRTNVTLAQATTERVPADTFWYARLGYGGLFGDRTYGAPGFGVGFRGELDALAVDVSFFNYQVATADSYSQYAGSSGAIGGSVLKLEALYFLKPRSNRSAYFGGGLSWGGTDFGRSWSGSGLQGELTAGYEFPRASTLRMFIQTDATLPFYQATSVRYSTDVRRTTVISTDHRYAPSVAISIGFGWQRDRRGRH